jgi:hypothetical protein
MVCGLFGNRSREKARRLIATAHTIAISSLTSFLDKFPALGSICKVRGAAGPQDWDFFMTVAGVGFALQTLGSRPSEKDLRHFTEGLQEHSPKWNAHAAAAFDDLTRFTQRNVSGEMDSLTAIGLWVLWNVKRENPTQEEMPLAPAIGRFLAANLAGRWEEL